MIIKEFQIRADFNLVSKVVCLFCFVLFCFFIILLQIIFDWLKKLCCATFSQSEVTQKPIEGVHGKKP